MRNSSHRSGPGVRYTLKLLQGSCFLAWGRIVGRRVRLGVALRRKVDRAVRLEGLLHHRCPHWWRNHPHAHTWRWISIIRIRERRVGRLKPAYRSHHGPTKQGHLGTAKLGTASQYNPNNGSCETNLRFSKCRSWRDGYGGGRNCYDVARFCGLCLGVQLMADQKCELTLLRGRRRQY
jgi:hypothetical protein